MYVKRIGVREREKGICFDTFATVSMSAILPINGIISVSLQLHVPNNWLQRRARQFIWHLSRSIHHLSGNQYCGACALNIVHRIK